MAEEIAFENGRISNFDGIVTLTSVIDLYPIRQISLKSKTLFVDGRKVHKKFLRFQ